MTPVLIRCPVHPKFAEFKNEKQYRSILDKRYKNVAFLDFVKFRLPNKEFADMEHLNYIGARRFSVFFDSIIKDELLNETAVKVLKNNAEIGGRSPSEIRFR